MNLSFVTARSITTIISIFMLATSSPTQAQEKLLRTLTVTGEGVENIATSLAEVSLGIEINGR